MRPTVTTQLVLWLSLLVASVGGIDAAVAGQWDSAAVFALLVGLIGVLTARYQSRRTPMPVRRDLADWLRARAAATAEEPEVIADRAIAAYRSGLIGVEDGGA